MKRHPVASFYLLAFAISWAGWFPSVIASRGIPWFGHPVFQILLILPAIGPTLAALIVQRACVGRAEANRWFRSLWWWRIGMRWAGIAVVLPALILLVKALVTKVFGLSPTWEPGDENRIGVAIFAFVVALLSNPWEEVGWRGFALPRLQASHSALASTLVVGALWGLWHLPLFFWEDNPMSTYPFAVWFVGTVAEAFIYTWLYNSTQGSVLSVALYHVLTNTYGPLIGGISVTASSIVNVVVAAVLVAVYGGTHLSRGGRIRME